MNPRSSTALVGLVLAAVWLTAALALADRVRFVDESLRTVDRRVSVTSQSTVRLRGAGPWTTQLGRRRVVVRRARVRVVPGEIRLVVRVNIMRRNVTLRMSRLRTASLEAACGEQRADQWRNLCPFQLYPIPGRRRAINHSRRAGPARMVGRRHPGPAWTYSEQLAVVSADIDLGHQRARSLVLAILSVGRNSHRAAQRVQRMLMDGD